MSFADVLQNIYSQKLCEILRNFAQFPILNLLSTTYQKRDSGKDEMISYELQVASCEF